MEELKPCPFCGGKAGITYTTQGDKYFSVVCTQCGIIIGLYAETENMKWENRFYKTPKEAVEAWNRRADDGHKSED